MNSCILQPHTVPHQGLLFNLLEYAKSLNPFVSFYLNCSDDIYEAPGKVKFRFKEIV